MGKRISAALFIWKQWYAAAQHKILRGGGGDDGNVIITIIIELLSYKHIQRCFCFPKSFTRPGEEEM